MNPTNGGWLILLTLIAAMILTVAELPIGEAHWLRWLGPDWSLAVLFFWAIAAPARIGMVSAWCVGFFFDALLGASHPFGLHGIGFAFTVFVVGRLHQRLGMVNVVQQSALLLALALAVQVFKGLVRAFLVDGELSPLLALPAVTTVLVYPLLATILRRLADRFVAH